MRATPNWGPTMNRLREEQLNLPATAGWMLAAAYVKAGP